MKVVKILNFDKKGINKKLINELKKRNDKIIDRNKSNYNE